MKNILRSSSLFALALVLALGSCQKAFDEMNIDPNNPSEVNPEWILTAAQRNMMEYTWDEWANGRFGMVYAQYWAQNQYTSESRYQLREGVNNNYWGYYYVDCLANLQEIIDVAEAKTEDEDFKNNQIAVARILKVWMFQMVTDIYGNVPYFNALKGQEATNPEYDGQDAIYTDLLKELTEASNQINVDKGGYSTGDIVYGGEMGNWKKFANSLKLRVAMRMADVSPAAAQTAIEEAVNAGVFTSNADDALFRYTTASPNNNPINENRKTREDFAVSNTLVDYLDSLKDPRLAQFAAPALSSNTYVGMTYGLSEANATAISMGAVSQPSAKVLAADHPAVFMTYAEVCFLLAEAAERGYAVGGTTIGHYDNGITASMNYWGVTDVTAINDYIAQTAVNYSLVSGSWREKIGRQKWIAMYMQGIQGWTEWRRLDFGLLQLPADGVMAGTGIPVRRTYPTDEQTLNADSYSAAVAAQGADELSTKVWWDAN